MKRFLAALAILAATYGFFGGQKTNPPGFYLDESSVAYNALTIARAGVDEYGIHSPLFFKAFGEYKNPLFIYLLAAVFKALTPSNLIARRVAAMLVHLAAVVLAWLAWRVSGRGWIALLTFLTSLTTPMLFETSRLAFEVAAMPLSLALFLLAAHRSAHRERWNWTDVVSLAATLTLFTYSYTSARLLGPLFALVFLSFFFTRGRAAAAVVTLLVFSATTIIPMAVYNEHEKGALTARARAVSVLRFWPDHRADVIRTLEHNTIDNLLPLGLILCGDPNERHHVGHGAGGGILAMTFLLAAASLVAIWRTRPVDRWWLFVVFGALASAIPAAIAPEVFHTFRLLTYPLFLIVMSLPALSEPRFRPLVVAALLLGIFQAGWFAEHFHKWGPERVQAYDTGIADVVRETLKQPARPIFYSSGVTVHALWNASLAHADLTKLNELDITAWQPSNALIIAGTSEAHDVAREVSRHGDYVSYYSK